MTDTNLDLAALRRRLDAYARDAVTHGDMTPAAARALALILNDMGVRDYQPIEEPEEYQYVCRRSNGCTYRGGP